MSALLSVIDLKHDYIARTVDHPLSFNVTSGSCIWIKGENGTGKSTFLKLSSGILPTPNEAILVNTPFTYLGPEWGFKQQVTLTHYQRFMTVCGLERSFWDQWTPNFPKNRVMDTFSSGQKLWIRLGGALRSDRALWLLDEPTRFLDAAREKQVWDLINQHCQKGGAVVVASHAAVTEWVSDCQTVQF